MLALETPTQSRGDKLSQSVTGKYSTMKHINCRHCNQPLKIDAGDLTPRMVAAGRQQRYFVSCFNNNKECPLDGQTFYVTDEADYLSRDLTAYYALKSS